MMKGLIQFLLMLLSLETAAQKIRVIVPHEPVIIGNAFQVQYVLTDAAGFESIQPPVSDSIQMISGPHSYNGNMMIDGRMQPIRNITFTLVASALGKIQIRQVEASYKNRAAQITDAAFINVLPQYKASFNARSNYTDVSLYAPSSKADLDQLIKENLFVRAIVDKKTCYLGEAVVATFKLYSRLQSSSEVMNSPSLYGFSVMDILNTNEAHGAVENLDGRIYNTSVLRKVQLYPEQPGDLVIDPMELDHEIEFDDSLHAGNKIIEKRTTSTTPITIHVKELPAKKPVSYNGAVGQFQISVPKNYYELEKGQTGTISVIISGKGNYNQMGPPSIEWPGGFDVFDPATKEKLDKNKVPLKGWRSYDFSFAAEQTGSFTIPPLRFSYFDLQSGTFKTLSSDSIQVLVKERTKRNLREIVTPESKNRTWLWWPLLLFILAMSLFLGWHQTKKKKAPEKKLTEVRPTLTQEIKAIDHSGLTDQAFGLQLQKLLVQARRTFRLTKEQEDVVLSIIRECELMAYAPITKGEKEGLIKRSLEILEPLEQDHSAYL